MRVNHSSGGGLVGAAQERDDEQVVDGLRRRQLRVQP